MFEQIKKKKIKKGLSLVGFEPSTPCFRVKGLIH